MIRCKSMQWDFFYFYIRKKRMFSRYKHSHLTDQKKCAVMA